MPAPRSAAPDFDQLVAVAVDDEDQVRPAVLGKLVFFTISDELRITSEELDGVFEAYGVDRSFAPKAINPGSELSRLLKSSKQAAVIANKRFDLEFLPEQKIDGSVYAPLVRRRRKGGDDAEGNEWDMRTVAAVAWDPKEPTSMEYDIKSRYAEEYPYEDLLEELREEFSDRCQFYSGSVIRQVVTKILNETMSIPTRPSGGVWLVPRDAIDLLERVEQMVQLLDAEYRREPKEGEKAKGSRDTEFNSIIVVDGSKNRVFVRGKVEEKVVRDLETSVQQLYTLAAAGKQPKAAEIAEAAKIRQEALAVLAHYQDVIGSESARVTDMLELFDRAVAQLNLPGADG